MCSAGSGIANLTTSGSMMGEAGKGAKKEAAGLSANLRTLGSMRAETGGGDHGEARGLNVLLGLMIGDATVGGYQPEADGLGVLLGRVRPCWRSSCLSFCCLRMMHYTLF